MKIDEKKIQDSDMQFFAKELKSGKVVAYPTDTIYGLGCVATNIKAIKKIMAIKNIRERKALIVLIDSFAMLKKYCQVTEAQERYAREIWKKDKPTTIIFMSKNNLPKEILGEGSTLAVRLPRNDFLIKIIKKIKAPLISTSLNITGQAPLSSLENLEDYFKDEKPDLIIDAGITKKKRASKIIDLTNLQADGSGIKKIR